MLLTILGALGTLLAAQTPMASLEGVVRDEHTGGPIAGAVVSLPDISRVVETDARGRYHLADVPPGPQHVAVRFLGYAPRTLHALVPAGGRLELGLALRPVPLQLRGIEVRPPPALAGLEEDGPAESPDRVQSIQAIRNHPMLAEPDALQSLGGGEVAIAPETPSGVHVRGAPSDQVTYLLDGIPVLSPYHSAGTFTAWNPDALAEIRLSSVAPPFEAPDALAAVIAAETRSPGTRHHTQGSVGTGQARLTLDGPLAGARAGYLVSLRSGFAGYPVPDPDPSYLRSESGDRLAKVEAAVLGGRLRLLGYDNENEISTAADAAGILPRNRFEWSGSSYGADWRRSSSRGGLRVTAWSATALAGAGWRAPDERLAMRSRRHDLGLVLALDRRTADARSSAGLRLEHRGTDYRVTGGGEASAGWRLRARSPVATAFAEHERSLDRRTRLTVGLVVAAGHEVRLLPRARVAWQPSRRWTLSASYAELRQDEQSLRNPESVVGHVFPADLFIGAEATGVPGARARQAVLAADVRLSPGLRLGAQAFHRHATGLLLVAPRTGGPFADGSFVTGQGSASGLSVTAAARGARVGLVASYGLQSVNLAYGDSSYVPSFATAHLLETGVIVYPAPTLSLRLGAAAGTGRRTTAASGWLEWESCNLLDRGCELTGSPETEPDALGARRLPGYLRLDAGVRKHWHLHLGRRDATVALFATVSNLFGRRNVLTYSLDPETGAAQGIGMRPLAPLVVGLDWRL